MKNLVLKKEKQQDIYGTVYTYPIGTIVVKNIENNIGALSSPLVIECHGHGLNVYAELEDCEII